MILKNQMLKHIMQKYNLKEGTKINMFLIEEISKKENIEMKDIICMFQIRYGTMYNLKNNRQKFTVLHLNKFNTIIDGELLKKGSIDYEEFNNLKKYMKLKSYTLMRILGISRYYYNKLRNGEIKRVAIIDTKTKHIVDLIKIDLKYMDGYRNRYYTEEELNIICRRNRITLDNFLKYYNRNPKHYKFNKIVIERNDKGFWIGENEKVSENFLESNYNIIVRRLRKIISRHELLFKWNRYKDDLINDAIIEIYEKCGNIEKNFFFDMKLLLNILMKKAKYMMLRSYIKKYKNNYMSFEENTRSIYNTKLFISQYNCDVT